MRRFELVDGSSRKFWEIARERAAVTVRFGRIGTNGQTQTKAFDDEKKATAELDKLVKEKTKKGYAEIAVEPEAVAAKPAAPAPAPAPKPKAAKAPPPPTPRAGDGFVDAGNGYALTI